MPVIDPKTAPIKLGSTYPPPFDAPCADRTSIRLSDAGELSQFGVHLVILPAGAWSSQRHHHSHEDELVYILSGHPTFIDNDGERVLNPGDVTAHPAGDGNAHHMINRTDAPVTFLAIGARNPERDHVVYADIDLDLPATGNTGRIFKIKTGDNS